MSIATLHPPLVLPDDEHNRALVRHVHPPDWVNPRPAARYNLVVIGAETAGLVSAVGAASLGAKVAIVERHLMGSDCGSRARSSPPVRGLPSRPFPASRTSAT